MHAEAKTAALTHEYALWARGYRHVVGLDEAGRGAWAGPVSAGAVCLPTGDDRLRQTLEGVRDSKLLTASGRAGLIERIKTTALAWGIGSASSAEIDSLGIVPATCLAMERALIHMHEHARDFTPDFLLLDSIHWPALKDKGIPYEAIVRGDQLSLSIAAASILAKVWRDELMCELDQTYPDYGFRVHKGYGVPQHRLALDEHGNTPQHRRSFAPMRLLDADKAGI